MCKTIWELQKPFCYTLLLTFQQLLLADFYLFTSVVVSMFPLDTRGTQRAPSCDIGAADQGTTNEITDQSTEKEIIDVLKATRNDRMVTFVSDETGDF